MCNDLEFYNFSYFSSFIYISIHCILIFKYQINLREIHWNYQRYIRNYLGSAFVPGSTNPKALLLMHILISRNGLVVAGFALTLCFYFLYILVIFLKSKPGASWCLHLFSSFISRYIQNHIIYRAELMWRLGNYKLCSAWDLAFANKCLKWSIFLPFKCRKYQ